MFCMPIGNYDTVHLVIDSISNSGTLGVQMKKKHLGVLEM